MIKENKFTIELEQLEGYEFNVRFNLDGVDDLLADEPPPLGQGAGPNPSRLLAAAAANCLSASLLYCVTKNAPPAGSVHTTATCSLTRNKQGRLRIGGISVQLRVNGDLEESARMQRCLALFEEFCVVTASLRDGFPVEVAVLSESGKILHQGSV